MKKPGRYAAPILGLALLGLGLFGAIGPSGAARAPLRFAWLSDTHIGSDRGAGDLKASVADINRQSGLSFVLVTGDVTDMGLYANFRAAKDILDGLDVPYHIIPGNHDTKWSESGGSDFRRIWGDDRFAFESGGFRFIGVSQGPVMKFGDGHFAPQDVRWLDEVLAEAGAAGKPTFFVTHYPLDGSVANGYVVLDRLKTVPTVAVLAGHGHRNQALDFEGLAGVMGRANVGTKDTAPGYTIVEIGAKAVTFAERTAGRTSPPWHRIELEKNGLPVVARGKPSAGAAPVRPDFGVNKLFPGVRERWRFDAGWTIASSAAVVGETVVFGDASGKVRALRVADGSIAWEFETDDPVYSTPAVAGGRVVFGIDERRHLRPGRRQGQSRLEGPDGRARRRQPEHLRWRRLHRVERPRLPGHRSGSRAGPCGVTTASTASSRRNRSSRATSSSSAPGTAGSTRWT